MIMSRRREQSVNRDRENENVVINERFDERKGKETTGDRNEAIKARQSNNRVGSYAEVTGRNSGTLQFRMDEEKERKEKQESELRKTIRDIVKEEVKNVYEDFRNMWRKFEDFYKMVANEMQEIKDKILERGRKGESESKRREDIIDIGVWDSYEKGISETAITSGKVSSAKLKDTND